MLLDVRRDERAKRHDLEPLLPRIAQRGCDERRAEAPAFAHGVDLGMRERDAVPATVIRRKPDDAVAEHGEVAVVLLVVHNLEVAWLGVDGLARPIEPEALDELPRRIRPPRVDVIVVALTMVVGPLPRRDRLEVAKDVARADDDVAVVQPKCGDRVAPRHLLQLRPVVGPRLDGLGEELEPELVQDLAHRRRVRAPLRLVERQQRALRLAPAAEDEAAEREAEPERPEREAADRDRLSGRRQTLPASERLLFLGRQLLAATLLPQRTAGA